MIDAWDHIRIENYRILWYRGMKITRFKIDKFLAIFLFIFFIKTEPICSVTVVVHIIFY